MFPGESALLELLVVRELVENGCGLWSAIANVRDRYQLGYAGGYVRRSASALCMPSTWLQTHQALVVLRGAIELALAESGLSIMPRAADTPARLQCEFERQSRSPGFRVFPTHTLRFQRPV